MPAAIVLAGGGPEPQLAPGLPNKAFLRMGGLSLVERVASALRGSPSIGRTVVVGPPEPLLALLGSSVEIVPDQGAMLDNIAAGAARFRDEERVVAVASDLPLITAEAVEGFLGRCAGDADFCYAIVPQAAIEGRFPTARKTYVKVADGTYCGGSIVLFPPRALERIRPLVEHVIAARKKPWLLAQIFGLATIMRFASGRLSIAELEERAHAISGLRCRAVVLDGPEMALDVDAGRPENLAALRAVLEPPQES